MDSVNFLYIILSFVVCFYYMYGMSYIFVMTFFRSNYNLGAKEEIEQIIHLVLCGLLTFFMIYGEFRA